MSSLPRKVDPAPLPGGMMIQTNLMTGDVLVRRGTRAWQIPEKLLLMGYDELRQWLDALMYVRAGQGQPTPVVPAPPPEPPAPPACFWLGADAA